VLALAPHTSFDTFLGTLHFDADTEDATAAIRSQLGISTPYVAVHCDTAPEKMWPIERWLAVIRRFLANCSSLSAVIVGAPTCVRTLQQLRAAASERVILALGLPLPESQCLVAQSTLFLGIDSCFLHVADLARVPSVGLFGRTRANHYGFLVAPHISIQAPGRLAEIHENDVFGAAMEIATTDRRALRSRIEMIRSE
jgi:ADP-heptose:LPS heptosyltransferase